jgi:CrcB protein
MAGLISSEAVAIGVGAFMGAMSRYQAGRLAGEFIASDPKRFGSLNGWHTAGINVVGSFILGGVTAAPLVTTPSKSTFGGLTPRSKLLMGVGFCGSFTTFSSYSVDVVTWLAKGETAKVASYILANNVGGVMAAAAGWILVKKIFGGAL